MRLVTVVASNTIYTCRVTMQREDALKSVSGYFAITDQEGNLMKAGVTYAKPPFREDLALRIIARYAADHPELELCKK